MSRSTIGRITRLPSADSASSNGPVPGSVPTETYAVRVAARRTSGWAVTTSARSRARDPISCTDSRLLAVRIWSRRAIFATAAPEVGRSSDRDCDEGTSQAYDRSMSSAGLERARAKMTKAGIDPVAIETFAHYYRLLEHG